MPQIKHQSFVNADKLKPAECENEKILTCYYHPQTKSYIYVEKDTGQAFTYIMGKNGEGYIQYLEIKKRGYFG